LTPRLENAAAIHDDRLVEEDNSCTEKSAAVATAPGGSKKELKTGDMGRDGIMLVWLDFNERER